ncbi:MAG: Uma2 family endonuclease [Proteobacteria bacterium]|nr:Uma2 family endonuclease [Pseudomonadota bacterium]
MNWQEICNDPLFRDLPYKIELNEWGKIVMSPASSKHSLLQGLIQDALREVRKDGFVYQECPVQTSKGVKAADVAWASAEFVRTFGHESPLSKAPEICVEVLSPSNSVREMEEKRELYFARGAHEVWLCGENGKLSFYDCTGEILSSRLFPDLARIETDCLH